MVGTRAFSRIASWFGAALSAAIAVFVLATPASAAVGDLTFGSCASRTPAPPAIAPTSPARLRTVPAKRDQPRWQLALRASRLSDSVSHFSSALPAISPSSVASPNIGSGGDMRERARHRIRQSPMDRAEPGRGLALRRPPSAAPTASPTSSSGQRASSASAAASPTTDPAVSAPTSPGQRSPTRQGRRSAPTATRSTSTASNSAQPSLISSRPLEARSPSAAASPTTAPAARARTFRARPSAVPLRGRSPGRRVGLRRPRTDRRASPISSPPRQGQITFGGCVSDNGSAGSAPTSRGRRSPTRQGSRSAQTGIRSTSPRSRVRQRQPLLRAPAGQITFGGCVSDGLRRILR